MRDNKLRIERLEKSCLRSNKIARDRYEQEALLKSLGWRHFTIFIAPDISRYKVCEKIERIVPDYPPEFVRGYNTSRPFPYNNGNASISTWAPENFASKLLKISGVIGFYYE